MAKKKIETYLDCFLPKGKNKKQIEAVFISHFHANHINGLQYLLENADVNYLFLPQVTENILLETLVHNLFKTNTYSRVNSFIMSLFSGKLRLKGKKTKIIKVSYANVTNNIPKEFPANNSSNIQNEGCRPIIVTENKSSMRIYQCEID